MRCGRLSYGLSVVLAGLLAALHAQAVKLRFKQQECMTYQMDMYHSFYGSFVALPDVYGHTARYNLVVTAPSGTKVHETLAATEGKFNLVPYETGRFLFCLDLINDAALSRYVLERDVVWDLHATTADLHHNHMKGNEAEALWTNVEQIDSQIQQLRATQQYLYWRERRHRQTVESTNARVVWYALARTAALVAVSIGQVVFIRRMFAK